MTVNKLEEVLPLLADHPEDWLKGKEIKAEMIMKYRQNLNSPEYMKNAIESIADGLMIGSIKLVPSEDEKFCRLCKKAKPLNDFYIISNGKRKLPAPYCKPCWNAYQKKRKMGL